MRCYDGCFPITAFPAFLIFISLYRFKKQYSIVSFLLSLLLKAATSIKNPSDEGGYMFHVISRRPVILNHPAFIRSSHSPYYNVSMAIKLPLLFIIFRAAV